MIVVFHLSGVAWQLTLNRPVVQKEAVHDKGNSDAKPNDGDLCILLFRSLISSDKPVMSDSFKFITSVFIYLFIYVYALCLLLSEFYVCVKREFFTTSLVHKSYEVFLLGYA